MRSREKNSGPAKLSKAYEVRSKQFDEINVVSPWHRLYREATLPKLLKTVASKKSTILDAGGGTGIFSSELAKRGHDVTLVDILPDMLQLARRRAAKTPFRVLQGNVEDLSFLEPASFDAIICTQVLNFCPHLDRVFKEFARLLKPSGFLFADIDNAYFEQVIKPRLSSPDVEYIGEINEAQKNEFLGNALALMRSASP
jgi:ubiquinone/menaquinone biosynthesis C-methylase UbiE